ncbi:molybdate ABC transporter permease subunit [Novosphingobium colocasiae]
MNLVIRTTIELAAITTVLLLLLSTPVAWWLARSRQWAKEIVGALVALPLILPPTVIGFYVLVALGPQSPLMALLHPFGVRTLAFTFEGLVIGSLLYSLPFAVQPLRTAFELIGDRPLEVAATLGGQGRSIASSRWPCRWPGAGSCRPASWCSRIPLVSSAWC